MPAAPQACHDSWLQPIRLGRLGAWLLLAALAMLWTLAMSDAGPEAQLIGILHAGLYWMQPHDEGGT